MFGVIIVFYRNVYSLRFEMLSILFICTYHTPCIVTIINGRAKLNKHFIQCIRYGRHTFTDNHFRLAINSLQVHNITLLEILQNYFISCDTSITKDTQVTLILKYFSFQAMCYINIARKMNRFINEMFSVIK